VVPLLKSVPGLRPVAIFDEIRRRHPEIGAGVRRMLERRIRAWRALNGRYWDLDRSRGWISRAGRPSEDNFHDRHLRISAVR
jgi:hypothetical protein